MPQKPAVERRQFPRELLPLTNGGVSVMLPATDGTLVYSNVWNLSRGGACLLLPRGGGDKLLAEAPVLFSDASGRETRLLVRVVWIENLGRSFFVGIAFEPSPLATGTFLDDYLKGL
mgnify:CR=1 FL=1